MCIIGAALDYFSVLSILITALQVLSLRVDGNGNAD